MHPCNSSLPRQQVARRDSTGLLQRRFIMIRTPAHRRTNKANDPHLVPKGNAVDEQLVHELNSAHLWLHDEQQSEEFGLDDVEAHLASRRGAQVSNVSKKGGRRSKQGAKSGPGAASTLADVNPESADLPSWVEELREQGFDVLGRRGELFLQRGTVEQQHNNNSSSRSSTPAVVGSQGSRSSSGAVGQEASVSALTPAQQLAQEKLEEAAAAIPDSNLGVRREFDPRAWQQQTQPVWAPTKADDKLGSTWYSAGGISSDGITIHSNSQQGTAKVGQQNAAASKHRSVQKQLLGFNNPNRLLAYVENCFPAWSSNGCWLLHQTRVGTVPAPTPGEAAAALKGVALAAKRACYNLVQTQGLARDRRVLGLVECLRLTPPRSPPQQPASISKRLWDIAKAYWLHAGAAGAAAQQELLTASRMAAATGVAAAEADGGAGLSVASGLNGGSVPSLGPLLAQLQSSGLTLTRQQLAAAQVLIRSRQEEQLRQQAFVNAIWAMSALGGPLFFQQEMDAICQVAASGRWRLSSSEVSDVLWALANARHWSRLLPQLEAALMAAGGVSACTAPELITVLWSYATLAHRPARLLKQLDSCGWAVKQAIKTPGAQHRGKTAEAEASRSWGQLPTEHHDEQGSVCRLDELSGAQLTSLIWSLACLQEVKNGLFRHVWVEVCKRGMALSGDVRQLVRVQQAALALQLEGDYKPQELYWDQGAAQLLGAAAKTFKAQSGVLQSKVHSSYQRSMASVLAKQRVMHVLEDNTTGYSVDITIPSLRVAIEADGPSHMSRNIVAGRGRVRLGATAMKRRHLQGLGWAVANISYEDWDTLANEEQRAAFLKQQLKSACAQLAAFGPVQRIGN